MDDAANELKRIAEWCWADRALELIEAGAEVDFRLASSETLLMWAAAANQSMLCCALLDRGLSVHDCDEFGRTPLHYAAPFEGLVELLLFAGAEPTRRDRFGDSPLDAALLVPNYKSARLVFSAGGTVNEEIWLRLPGQWFPPSIFDLIESRGVSAPRFTGRPYEFLEQALDETDWDLAIWLLRRAIREGATAILEPGTLADVVRRHDHCLSSVDRLALTSLIDLAEG